MNAQNRPIVSAIKVGKNFARRRHHNISRGVSDILRNILCLPAVYDRDEEEFWAVENITLDIYPGDAIGVIGRNGGGKTTSMRLLSGLLAPTRGSVAVNGEIQALINLGAGFNQRLSGRENVTNGIALRGLDPQKSANLLEKIIDFSEIGPFIDSPVETYSSGMKARLGFALCIFLEPDLIVIDEALSVGDLAFQNKCKLQLQAMKQKGVAMLLVSHSMTSIRQFCDRAIWMHAGRVRRDGVVDDVVAEYLQFMDEQTRQSEAIEVSKRVGPAPAPNTPKQPKGIPWQTCVEKAYANIEPHKENDAKTAGVSYLAQNTNHTWMRPAISEQQVDELYGGYVEPTGIDDFSAILLANDAPTEALSANSAFAIEYAFRLTRPVRDLNVSLVFHTKDGKRLSTISTLNGGLLKDKRNGRVLARAEIADLCLAPGQYTATISVHEGNAYLWRDAILTFSVLPGRFMVWNQISMRYEYSIFSVSEE